MQENRSVFFHDVSEQDRMPVFRVSLEQWAGGYSINYPNRVNTILLFIREGKGRVTLKGKTVDVSAGKCVVFSPGHAHCIISDSEKPLTLHRLTLVGANGPKLMKSHLGTACGIIRTGNPHTISEVFMTMLITAEEGLPESKEIVKHYASILLLRMRSGQRNIKVDVSKSRRIWIKARHYMRENATASVSSTAEHCACTCEHLSRIFKQFGNESPRDYLMHIKMNKAAALLVGTADSLPCIARHLKYSEAYSFSKAFKRFFGKAPGIWRKENI